MEIKTFRPFSSFLRRIAFPKSYGGLAQASSFLVHLHVIVGRDHRPNKYGVLSLFATQRYQSVESFDSANPDTTKHRTPTGLASGKVPPWGLDHRTLSHVYALKPVKRLSTFRYSQPRRWKRRALGSSSPKSRDAKVSNG
jgi:hypothetical protein